MTDKEKIELIIQDKHLSSSEFCSEVCISPGTLSHIRSGRTEPSLNILRSIVQAFPDINPAWVFYGEEPMYKNTASSVLDDDGSDASSIYNDEEGASVGDAQSGLFAFPSGDLPLAGAASVLAGGNSAGVIASGSPAGKANPSRGVTAGVSAPSVNVHEIVAETLKQQQKPQRQVVEVRIFFDDGTFETFSAK